MTDKTDGLEVVAYLVDWPDEPDLGHYFCEEFTDAGRCKPLVTLASAQVALAAAVSKPLTKTQVGNYLRKSAHGDIDMYRNGFKDGVRYAEHAHNIRSK